MPCYTTVRKQKEVLPMSVILAILAAVVYLPLYVIWKLMKPYK